MSDEYLADTLRSARFFIGDPDNDYAVEIALDPGGAAAVMEALTAEVERLRHDLQVQIRYSNRYAEAHARKFEEVKRLRAEVAEHLLRADSLRAELRRTQDENERLYTELHLGQDEAKRLRAAVQAVRALPYHIAWIGGGFVVRKFDIDAALDGERDE